MLWLFVALSAVSVFLIAALTIGREARRLDALSPRAVYQLEQATEFVAERLPNTTQSRLTMEELTQLLVLHMNWLHSKGLLPDGVIDRKQDTETEVVISEESLVGYLLGEADRVGVEILDDVDVVSVTDVHLQYFEAIGAVGPPAQDL